MEGEREETTPDRKHYYVVQRGDAEHVPKGVRQGAGTQPEVRPVAVLKGEVVPIQQEQRQ